MLSVILIFRIKYLRIFQLEILSFSWCSQLYLCLTWRSAVRVSSSGRWTCRSTLSWGASGLLSCFVMYRWLLSWHTLSLCSSGSSIVSLCLSTGSAAVKMAVRVKQSSHMEMLLPAAKRGEPPLPHQKKTHRGCLVTFSVGRRRAGWSLIPSCPLRRQLHILHLNKLVNMKFHQQTGTHSHSLDISTNGFSHDPTLYLLSI